MYHEKPPLRLFAGNAVTYSKNFFYFTKFLKFIKLVPLMRGAERFLQNTYSDHVY